MKGVLSKTVLGFVLLSAPVYANPYQKYFPLKQGNQWTYKNEQGQTESTAIIQKKVMNPYPIRNLPSQEGLTTILKRIDIPSWTGNVVVPIGARLLRPGPLPGG